MNLEKEGRFRKKKIVSFFSSFCMTKRKIFCPFYFYKMGRWRLLKANRHNPKGIKGESETSPFSSNFVIQERSHLYYKVIACAVFMALYGLFCYNDCNRIGRNAYYKINDKGRLRNECWGILSLRRLFMDQKEVSQNQTKYIQFRLSEEQYNKLKISGETYGLSPNLYAKKLAQKSHLKKPYLEHDQAKSLLLELSKQGTNLNQIAKKLNQFDRMDNQDKELIEALRYTYGVLAQAQKGYKELWQQLQK